MSSWGVDVGSTDLEVFDAVVTAGSFGRAATALTMSQPAISERIARMERRLSVTLFIRTPRGVNLTAAGHALVPFARAQRTLLSDAMVAVRRTADVPSLIVACHSSLSATVVPEVLRALGSLERRVDFRDAHSDEIVCQVSDHEIDVGFVVPVTLPPGLARQRLAPDPIVCVCAPEDPLVDRDELRFTDLAERPLAINNWGSGIDEFNELVVIEHARPSLRRNVADPHTAMRLAVDFGHLAFVTATAARSDLMAGRLAQLDLLDLPNWRVELDLISPRGTTDPAVHRIADHFASARPTSAIEC